MQPILFSKNKKVLWLFLIICLILDCSQKLFFLFKIMVGPYLILAFVTYYVIMFKGAKSSLFKSYLIKSVLELTVNNLIVVSYFCWQRAISRTSLSNSRIFSSSRGHIASWKPEQSWAPVSDIKDRSGRNHDIAWQDMVTVSCVTGWHRYRVVYWVTGKHWVTQDKSVRMLGSVHILRNDYKALPNYTPHPCVIRIIIIMASTPPPKMIT